MMDRIAPSWPLVGPGIVFLALAAFYTAREPSGLVPGLFRVAIPVVLGLILIGIGLVPRYQWVTPDRPKRIGVWTVVGGLAGLMINFWFFALISLDGAFVGDSSVMTLNGVAIGAASGTIIGYFHTGVLERSEIIRHQKEQLDEFAEIVSHEVRNPLTVAQGNMRLFRATSDERHFDAALSNLEQVDRMIARMRYLVWAQRDELEVEPVNLKTVAGRAVRNVDGHGVSFEIPADRSVYANPHLLRSLFETLLGKPTGTEPQESNIRVGWLEDGWGFFVEGSGLDIHDEYIGVSDHQQPPLPPNAGGLDTAMIEQVAKAHGWELSVRRGSSGSTRIEISGLDPS